MFLHLSGGNMPNTGTMFASLRNIFCWITISRIISFLVIVFNPYGMNLVSLEESEDILHSRVLSIVALSGEVLISYTNVVICLIPVSLPTSLL